jgi:hypothetical protein
MAAVLTVSGEFNSHEALPHLDWALVGGITGLVIGRLHGQAG